MKISWGKEILTVKSNKSSRLKTKRVCENCGEAFLSARKTAKFCSDKCKVANWRKFNH